MKHRTMIALLVAVGLLVAGGVIGGIGWLLVGDPLQELPRLNFGYSQFLGRQLDGDFRADGEYAVAAIDIANVNVSWLSGKVTVRPYAGQEIRFAETCSKELTEENSLRWGVQGETLYIQYCQTGTVKNLPVKNLEVLIPQTLVLRSLDYDGTSADLTAEDLTLTELDAASTSGHLNLTGIVCEAADLDTTSGGVSYAGQAETIRASATSGDVRIDQTGSAAGVTAGSTSGDIVLSGAFDTVHASSTSGQVRSEGDFTAVNVEAETTSGGVSLEGSLEEISVETQSGKIVITSSTVLAQVELDTTSGDVVLTIPESSGFSLEFDTVSGTMDCEMPLQIHSGDTYLCGDGAAEFDVETTSGNLEIHAVEKT